MFKRVMVMMTFAMLLSSCATSSTLSQNDQKDQAQKFKDRMETPYWSDRFDIR